MGDRIGRQDHPRRHRFVQLPDQVFFSFEKRPALIPDQDFQRRNDHVRGASRADIGERRSQRRFQVDPDAAEPVPVPVGRFIACRQDAVAEVVRRGQELGRFRGVGNEERINRSAGKFG